MALQRGTRTFAPDALLITEGQPANQEIFYLSKGQAVVEVRGNVVGTIKAGEWFGELAAILGGPRTATVRAVTPCEVLVFKGIEDGSLYEAVAKDPKITRKLIEQLCQRVIETSQRHARETGEMGEQAMRYRRAISGTLFALEKLVEKYKSKVMEEVRDHLASQSGIPSGQAADADPNSFPNSRPVIFG
ncbi:MAG: cyclic nucleotide-binding domain-containing protein [Planctomycetes bacterium]|nr:cyclic nucleotide-binding domain-containing protein [Planctomycetota bacterium]